MQYPSSLDQRLPLIGNTFVKITDDFQSTTVSRPRSSGLGLRSAGRFNSSPPCCGISLDCDSKEKGMLSCDNPQSPSLGSLLDSLWEDLEDSTPVGILENAQPDADSAKSMERLSFAKRREESLSFARLSHQSFVASKKRRASRQTTGSSESGDQNKLPTLLGHGCSNPDKFTKTQDATAIYAQSLRLAEETRNAVLAKQQRREKRFWKAPAPSPRKAESLPVLLGRTNEYDDFRTAKSKVDEATKPVQPARSFNVPFLMRMIFLVSALFLCQMENPFGQNMNRS